MLAVALTAVGCTGGSSPAHEGLPAGHGGTLRIVFTRGSGTPYLFGAYDPQVSGDSAEMQFMRCCLFRTLLSYNGEVTAKGGTTPRSDLADSLPTVSEDGLTWMFRLKRGIHYAPPFENREIVAQDVIRGIERGLAPIRSKETKALCGGRLCYLANFWQSFFVGLIRGAAAFSSGRSDSISGLEARDPQTLVVHLTHPAGELEYLFALPVTAPVPPKPGDPTALFGAAQGHDLDYGKGFAVGSGPYMVEGAGAVDYSLPPAQQKPASGATKDSFTLVRNPAWDPSTDDLRVGYSDRIVVTGAKDLDAGERMVLRGREDLVGDFVAPTSLVENLRRSPKTADQVRVDPLDSITTLTLNTALPPMNDLHVRRALNFAIDKQALAAIFAKYMTLAAPASHTGLDSQEDDLLLNYAPYGDGSGDLRAAKQEMARSSYDRDGDGMCDAAACKRVKLVFPSDDPARVHLAQAIERQLAPLGIRVVLHGVDHDTWGAITGDPSKHFALNLVGYVKDFPSGADFFTVFSSEPLTAGEGEPTLLGATRAELRRWHYSVSSVPNVDDRIKQCDKEEFRPQVQCWASLDQYLTRQVAPWVPLLVWTGATITSSRVASFSFDQSTPYPGAALDRIQLKPGSR